jgi:hypothetical protein
MILSDVAIIDLRLQQRALAASLTALIHWPRRRSNAALAFECASINSPSPAPIAPAPIESELIASPTTEELRFRWRRHPRLRALTAEKAQLDPEEQQARRAAVRGLMLAREHDYAAAQTAFTEAAHCPELDLTTIPTFWRLTRAGQDAATQAYQEVGRDRDALVLATALDSTFRPHPLPALQAGGDLIMPDNGSIGPDLCAIEAIAENDPGPPQGEPGTAVRGRA